MKCLKSKKEGDEGEIWHMIYWIIEWMIIKFKYYITLIESLLSYINQNINSKIYDYWGAFCLLLIHKLINSFDMLYCHFHSLLAVPNPSIILYSIQSIVWSKPNPSSNIRNSFHRNIWDQKLSLSSFATYSMRMFSLILLVIDPMQCLLEYP